MTQEYNIPEGYEARIEGNKVIIAQKESEDERIRKHIIEILKRLMPCHFDGNERSECIAWLEKQKEQKPDYCHHEVDLSGCSDEYRKAYYDGWNNCNQQHAQLQAEQKPAEWSEEDEKYFDSIIESYKELIKDYFANHGVDYIPYNTPVVARTVVNDIKFLKSLRPQPHWKPSKEQMRALWEIYQGGKAQAPIVSLYEDLKKL